MKNRKLSARAVVSLMLSAILFCMPIGAFFANRTNTIEVHAEDTAEQKTESASDAENTVTPGNGREENSGTDTGEGKTEKKAQQKIRLKKHSLPQNAPAKKSAASMRWMKIVRCVQRTIRNVPISIRA